MASTERPPAGEMSDKFFFIKLTVAQQTGTSPHYLFVQDAARRCYMELTEAKGPGQITLPHLEAFAKTEFNIMAGGVSIWIYEDFGGPDDGSIVRMQGEQAFTTFMRRWWCSGKSSELRVLCIESASTATQRQHFSFGSVTLRMSEAELHAHANTAATFTPSPRGSRKLKPHSSPLPMPSFGATPRQSAPRRPSPLGVENDGPNMGDEELDDPIGAALLALNEKLYAMKQSSVSSGLCLAVDSETDPKDKRESSSLLLLTTGEWDSVKRQESGGP